MLRGALRRHVGMAATFAAAGALARASCESAPPVGLAEQRRATVVHRPGTTGHATTPLTLEYFALRGLGELSLGLSLSLSLNLSLSLSLSLSLGLSLTR